jgi:hypothetical protein
MSDQPIGRHLILFVFHEGLATLYLIGVIPIFINLT